MVLNSDSINVSLDEQLKSSALARDLLEPYRGKPFVLYFYPKDNTSGCTKQACAAEENYLAFKSMGVEVVGVSKDSGASHERFASKYNLTFPLISDVSGDLCAAFLVWKEKSMYGKVYWGIERSTFYIDESFVIRHIWRKVKILNHWNEVLKKIK